jgi:hypothetical protein
VKSRMRVSSARACRVESGEGAVFATA